MMQNPRSALRLLAALLPVALALLLTTRAAAEPPVAPMVDFNREVLPLLSDNCFQCHGPDAAERQADLRLDTREGALGERSENPVIVAGKPDDSPLYQRLATSDPDLRMPPADSGKTLSPQEIAVIRRWIEQGADWQAHWAFISPQRPTLPKVDQPSWCRNPLDYFVLAQLEQNGLQPEAEAERTTLLRRVTLDLTGLPPSPAEVAAFLNDTAPDAYERAVDRLLQSPHYGERMAIPWLDAARYADTSGYQTDGVRHMWRWRDWVIQALNRNQPFDQFTVEQLAGDLLPDPTLDQLIATGFNRNHRANSEGGIVFEEFLVEYAADRVETTATVWLGLTIGCARCHDHKYDPLTQRDFYSMMAYFNNLPERGRVIKYGNAEPRIPAPTPLQEEQLQQGRRRHESARRAVGELDEPRREAQQRWERSLSPDSVPAFSVDQGLEFHLPLDGDATIRGGDHSPAVAYGGEPVYPAGVLDRAAELAGRSYLDAGDLVTFDGADEFSMAAWIRWTPAAGKAPQGGTILSWMNPEDTRAAGLSVDVRDGKLQVAFGPRWLDDALRLETDPVIEPGRWHHVAVVYDGSQRARGLQLFVDGRRQPSHVRLDYFTGTFTVNFPLHVGARGELARWPGAIDEVRFYRRMLSPQEVEILACPETIGHIAATPFEQRSAAQRAKIDACFVERYAPEPIRTAHTALREAAAELKALRDRIPTTMVMRDRPQSKPTYLLMRGQYDQPGDRVAAGVPVCLPPLREDAPPNRLALARWLVRPDHPLTARVAVNRYWQTLFGEGLVKTMEDFGAQGQRPSHPRLLDWLAVEFVESGWDVKGLARLIVTSATYRQSSHVTEKKLQRDPDNRLISRAPRLRLPAELVRDQALAASGLLVSAIGGPSVKPYQPEGLWKEIASDTYTPDTGAALYRRGLYTFWKRTVPPPSMVTFDATSRETCVVQRARTNTPLQALALMNEQTFVEAARALARGMLREGSGDVDEQLAWGFQRVLARRPSGTERGILRAGYERWLARFQNQPQAARDLTQATELPEADRSDTPRLAALTLVANLILNLDETVTRE